MYAQLGNTRFEALVGFKSMNRSSGVDLAYHSRIGNRPLVEMTGHKLERYQIVVFVHIDFASPTKMRAEFGDYMETGQILPFIDGTGRILGDFVIHDIKEKIEQTAPNGNVMAMTLTMDLCEVWIDDREEQEQNQAIDNAFAREENVPTPIETLQPVPLEGRLASDAFLAINADTNQALTAVEDAGSNPLSAADLMADASRRLKRAQDSVGDLQETLQNSQQQVQGILDAGDGLQNAIQEMTDALDVQDNATAQNRLASLRGALGALSTSSGTYRQTLSRREL